MVKPRLRRATALRSLGRVGEARQEYERVVGMEEGCKEAQEGLRDCKQETGDLNYIYVEHLVLILGFIIRGGEGTGTERKNKKKPNVFIAVQARISFVIS